MVTFLCDYRDVDKCINGVSNLFSKKMTFHVERPNGSQLKAIVHITLSRVLKGLLELRKQDVKDWRDFSLGPRVIISFLIHNWNSLKNIKCKQVAHINSDGSRPRLEPFHEWRASGLEGPWNLNMYSSQKAPIFQPFSKSGSGPPKKTQDPSLHINTKMFWSVNKQLTLPKRFDM